MLLLILVVIAAISGFFGPFILWNRVANYFDNFAHSAIFSLALSNIFHLSEFCTLFLFAGLFSTLLCLCMFFKFRLDNNLLIIISSLFIGCASILNNYCAHDHGCDHEHSHSHEQQEHNREHGHNHLTHNHEEHENGIIQMFFGNNLESFDYHALLPYFYLAICLGLISVFFTRRWIFNVVNAQLMVQKSHFYLDSFAFLFILGVFSTISVKINGIMLAISTTIFPALIGKNFARSPYQMIIYSVLISVFVTVFSFFICQRFDIHYNGFIVIFEFLIFITSLLIKNFSNRCFLFREKNVEKSSIGTGNS